MKKIIIAAIVAAAAAATVFTACDSNDNTAGYTPAENENYFEIDGIYRVFAEEGEAQLIKDQLIATEIPIQVSSSAFDSAVITMTVDDNYAENSIFAYEDDMQLLNTAGIEAIYDALNLTPKGEISDYLLCSDSVNGMYTYNEKVHDSVTVQFDYDLVDYILANTADAYKYTFSYEDRSPTDGEVVGSGTFTVYISTDNLTVTALQK